MALMSLHMVFTIIMVIISLLNLNHPLPCPEMIQSISCIFFAFLLQGTTRAVVARLLSQLLDEIFTFHFPFFSCSKKNNITAVTAIYNPWICCSLRLAFSLSQDSTSVAVIYYWTFEPFHNGKLPEPNSRTLPTKSTLVISTSTDGRIKVGQLCSDVFSRCDKLREHRGRMTRWCLIIIK